MDDGKQQHRVSNLSVHPDVLVEWKESDLGSDESHDSSADRQEDEHAIHTQY